MGILGWILTIWVILVVAYVLSGDLRRDLKESARNKLKRPY